MEKGESDEFDEFDHSPILELILENLTIPTHLKRSSSFRAFLFFIIHHAKWNSNEFEIDYEDNPSIVNYNQNREFPFFRVVGNQRDHGMDSRNAETEDWPDRVERKGGERRFRFQGGLKVENPSCL